MSWLRTALASVLLALWTPSVLGKPTVSLGSAEIIVWEEDFAAQIPIKLTNRGPVYVTDPQGRISIQQGEVGAPRNGFPVVLRVYSETAFANDVLLPGVAPVAKAAFDVEVEATFGWGLTEKLHNIWLNDDVITENVEQFYVELVDTKDYNLGSQTLMSVLINDRDVTYIKFETGCDYVFRVHEDKGPVNIAFVLSPGHVSFNFTGDITLKAGEAIEDNDYINPEQVIYNIDGTIQAGSGENLIQFLGGERRTTIHIPIKKDGKVEGDETFRVLLHKSRGDPDIRVRDCGVTVVIEDDDTAPLHITWTESVTAGDPISFTLHDPANERTECPVSDFVAVRLEARRGALETLVDTTKDILINPCATEKTVTFETVSGAAATASVAIAFEVTAVASTHVVNGVRELDPNQILDPSVYILSRAPMHVSVDRDRRTHRLVGSADGAQGRLEVYVDEEWGTVCDDQWTHTEARVACKALGYEHAERSYLGGHFDRPPASVPIHYDDLACAGSETSLSDCDKNDNAHNCASDHSEDVGVRCTNTAGPEAHPPSVRGMPRIEGDRVYLEFTEPVMVQEFGEGTVSITVTMNDGTTRIAHYESGSGTRILVFRIQNEG